MRGITALRKASETPFSSAISFPIFCCTRGIFSYNIGGNASTETKKGIDFILFSSCSVLLFFVMSRFYLERMRTNWRFRFVDKWELLERRFWKWKLLIVFVKLYLDKYFEAQSLFPLFPFSSFQKSFIETALYKIVWK